MAISLVYPVFLSLAVASLRVSIALSVMSLLAIIGVLGFVSYRFGLRCGGFRLSISQRTLTVSSLTIRHIPGRYFGPKLTTNQMNKRLRTTVLSALFSACARALSLLFLAFFINSPVSVVFKSISVGLDAPNGIHIKFDLEDLLLKLSMPTINGSRFVVQIGVGPYCFATILMNTCTRVVSGANVQVEMSFPLPKQGLNLLHPCIECRVESLCANIRELKQIVQLFSPQKQQEEIEVEPRVHVRRQSVLFAHVRGPHETPKLDCPYSRAREAIEDALYCVCDSSSVPALAPQSFLLEVGQLILQNPGVMLEDNVDLILLRQVCLKAQSHILHPSCPCPTTFDLSVDHCRVSLDSSTDEAVLVHIDKVSINSSVRRFPKIHFGADTVVSIGSAQIEAAISDSEATPCTEKPPKSVNPLTYLDALDKGMRTLAGNAFPGIITAFKLNLSALSVVLRCEFGRLLIEVPLTCICVSSSVSLTSSLQLFIEVNTHSIRASLADPYVLFSMEYFTLTSTIEKNILTSVDIEITIVKPTLWISPVLWKSSKPSDSNSFDIRIRPGFRLEVQRLKIFISEGPRTSFSCISMFIHQVTIVLNNLPIEISSPTSQSTPPNSPYTPDQSHYEFLISLHSISVTSSIPNSKEISEHTLFGASKIAIRLAMGPCMLVKISSTEDVSLSYSVESHLALLTLFLCAPSPGKKKKAIVVNVTLARVLFYLHLPEKVLISISTPVLVASFDSQSEFASLELTSIEVLSSRSTQSIDFLEGCPPSPISVQSSLDNPLFDLLGLKDVKVTLDSQLNIEVEEVLALIPDSYFLKDVIENLNLLIKIFKFIPLEPCGLCTGNLNNHTKHAGREKIKTNANKPIHFNVKKASLVLEDNEFESRLNTIFIVGKEVQEARLERYNLLQERLRVVPNGSHLPFWIEMMLFDSKEWKNVIDAAIDDRSSPLFSAIIKNISATLHPLKRAEILNACRQIDSTTPKDFEFDFSAGADVTLFLSSISVKLRDYPKPFLELLENPETHHRITGRVLIIEPIAPQSSCSTILFKLPWTYDPLCIPRILSPIKVFASLKCQLQTALHVSHGAAFEPALADVSRVFDNFTDRSPDPSVPLPWWDKIRWLLHGSVHLTGESVRFDFLGSHNPYGATHETNGTEGIAIVANGSVSVLCSAACALELTSDELFVEMDSPLVSANGNDLFERNILLHLRGNIVLKVDPNFRSCDQSYTHHLVFSTAPENAGKDDFDSFKLFRSNDLVLQITLREESTHSFNAVTFTPKSLQSFMDFAEFIAKVRSPPLRTGKLFPHTSQDVVSRKLSVLLSRVSLKVNICQTILTLWNAAGAIHTPEEGVGIRAVVNEFKVDFSCAKYPPSWTSPPSVWYIDTTELEFRDIEFRAVRLLPNQKKEPSFMTTGTENTIMLSPTEQRFTYEEFEVEEVMHARFANHQIPLYLDSVPFFWTPVLVYCRNSDIGCTSSSRFAADIDKIQLLLYEKYLQECTDQNVIDVIQKNIKNLKNEDSHQEDMYNYVHAFIAHNPRALWNEIIRNIVIKFLTLQQRSYLVNYYLSNALLSMIEKIDALRDDGILSVKLKQDIEIHEQPIMTEKLPLPEVSGKRPLPALPVSPEDDALCHLVSDGVRKYLIMQFINPQLKLETVKNEDQFEPQGICTISTENACMTQYHSMRKGKHMKTITLTEIKDARFDVAISKESAVAHGFNAPYLSNTPGMWLPLEDLCGYNSERHGKRIISNASIRMRYEKINPVYYLEEDEERMQKALIQSTGSDSSELDNLFQFEFTNFALHCDSLVYLVIYNVVSKLFFYRDPQEIRMGERLQSIILMSDRSELSSLYAEIKEMRTAIRSLQRALCYDAQILETNLDGEELDGTAQWGHIFQQLEEYEEQFLILLDAVKKIRRPFKSNDKTAYETQLMISDVLLRMLSTETGEPFAEFRLSNVFSRIRDYKDGSRSYALRVGKILGTNLLPSQIYRDIVAPISPNASGSVVELYMQELPAVAGISIVKDLQIAFASVKFQMTFELGKHLLNFFFPLKIVPLAPTDSPAPKKRSKYSDIDDDIDEMKFRAFNNMSFIHVHIPSVQHCISYRGSKERNLEDVHDFVFTLREIEYHDKTWTWLEFIMQIRREIFRTVLSHTGQLVREKLFSRKSTMNLTAEEPKVTTTSTLSLYSPESEVPFSTSKSSLSSFLRLKKDSSKKTSLITDHHSSEDENI